MRYTEARMRKISEEIMADIEKETVDFQFLMILCMSQSNANVFLRY
jgi:tRNA(Phe) wybutosine-synthesizing methylase Tyw3